MNPKKIVVTGGPSTGKTSLIEGLESAGFPCFPEVIRSMTLEAKEGGELSKLTQNPIASVSDPLEFNRKILQARTNQYHESFHIDGSLVFFDRGIPDILAYMDYFDQRYGDEFVLPSKTLKYDFIFLLPMWEGIYVADSERFESYEEALQIHDQLWAAYTRLGYVVNEVPKDSVANRIQFILKRLNY